MLSRYVLCSTSTIAGLEPAEFMPCRMGLTVKPLCARLRTAIFRSSHYEFKEGTKAKSRWKDSHRGPRTDERPRLLHFCDVGGPCISPRVF